MKNIIWILLFVVFSCANEDVEYKFEKLPEERINLVKKEYNDILLAAPNGWKTYFGTTNKLGRWLILMKFDENGTVTIKSDSMDHYYVKGVAVDNTISYKVDFTQSPELIFESFSQFSAWNELAFDSDGDGTLDRYAGPGSQFIIEKYEDGKFYMMNKSDIGVGKNDSDISRFVFEKAEVADWDIKAINGVKKGIHFDKSKGEYMRFSYDGKFLESVFDIDAESRIVYYYTASPNGALTERLPFYITNEGFTMVNSIDIPGIGVVKNFFVDVANNNAITCVEDKKLTVLYTNTPSSLSRTPFEFFDNLYLGIEVYQSTGEPMGKNFEKLIDDLRPPYSAEEQHINLIYFAKNISKDMGDTPFLYEEEVTLVFADTDPSYSGADLYGNNATFVHIPVNFITTESRMLNISVIGSIEDAFIKAYPDKIEYAKQKTKEVMPLIIELFASNSWGLYLKDYNTTKPIVDFKNENYPDLSFFTVYPYTQQDVDR